MADHLVDDLAEIEARVAGQPTLPDGRHASAITTPADLVAFTAEDLDEESSYYADAVGDLRSWSHQVELDQ